jgi:hypothetical protein
MSGRSSATVFTKPPSVPPISKIEAFSGNDLATASAVAICASLKVGILVKIWFSKLPILLVSKISLVCPMLLISKIFL